MNKTVDTSIAVFGENIPSPFVFLVGLPLLFSGIDNKSVGDLLGSEYLNCRHISGNQEEHKSKLQWPQNRGN